MKRTVLISSTILAMITVLELCQASKALPTPTTVAPTANNQVEEQQHYGSRGHLAFFAPSGIQLGSRWTLRHRALVHGPGPRHLGRHPVALPPAPEAAGLLSFGRPGVLR